MKQYYPAGSSGNNGVGDGPKMDPQKSTHEKEHIEKLYTEAPKEKIKVPSNEVEKCDGKEKLKVDKKVEEKSKPEKEKHKSKHHNQERSKHHSKHKHKKHDREKERKSSAGSSKDKDKPKHVSSKKHSHSDKHKDKYDHHKKTEPKIVGQKYIDSQSSIESKLSQSSESAGRSMQISSSTLNFSVQSCSPTSNVTLSGSFSSHTSQVGDSSPLKKDKKPTPKIIKQERLSQSSDILGDILKDMDNMK